MSRHLLVALLLFAIALPARAERLWLVIGASDGSPAGIARKGKALAPVSTTGFVIRTRDCGEKRNVFAWVAAAESSPADAQSALARLRASVKDAYVKRCDVKARSLLAFRITAVDASIADVPPGAVNWQDEDRVSTIRFLPDERAIVIVRHFVAEEEDPIEGRRERVILVEPTGRRLTLEENCISPGTVAVRKGRVAFDCAREQAGDNLLHSAVAFSIKGERLAEIEHCRKPRWSSDQTLVCDGETVGPDGVLKLRPRRFQVADK